MAKVTVYNLDKKSVGELEASDDVFGGENEALFYEIVSAAGVASCGHPQGEVPHGGPRDRREDVPPEGHGPRASR
ncbi:MAG: hypothetical protein R3B82_01225 [Sandaracinaceae bacterium]